MRDEEDREILLGAQLRDDLVEECQSALINARDGLIEEEQVWDGVEREREENALQFSARECAEAAVDEVLRPHARKALRGTCTIATCGAEPDGARRDARHKEIHDGGRCAHVEAEVLRDVADDGAAGMAPLGVDEADVSRVRHLAEDGAQEG